MTTNVQVSTDDVQAIALAGKNIIAAMRMVKLDEAIEEAMKETRWSFTGRKPVYASREEAIAFLKKPRDCWLMADTFQYITEQLYSGHEYRLGLLGNMAKSSVDGTMFLSVEDHKLLRYYAGKIVENEAEAEA